jgi:uncharacterized protein (DUF1501 family)
MALYPNHSSRTPVSRPAPNTSDEQALARHAAQTQAALCAQDEAWAASGWTRRRFLAGLGMAGVAALGSQLVTTRVAYAAGTASARNTLVTVFLRGAADGLRILVPASADLGVDYLHGVRATLVPASSGLISLPGTGGWALNAAMRPLYDLLWNTGELAFVPAVASPSVTRSHFQSQQFLERGGSTSTPTGWLDRVLAQLGPGTTFRAVATGDAAPAALAGNQPALVLDSLAGFTFPGYAGIRPAAEAAIRTLYRGQGGTLGEDIPTTLTALSTATKARSAVGVRNGAAYPAGNFSAALKDVAALLRAEVGLQVATVDVGGWDTHTHEAVNLDAQLSSAAKSLAAFMKDLGPTRRKRVTVLVVTEFGRRVAMNGSGGTDHGHGSVAWLLGGGVAGKAVHGTWQQLSDGVLDHGDVPALNSPFDVMGELVQKRLGIGSLTGIFPGHSFAPLGVART